MEKRSLVFWLYKKKLNNSLIVYFPPSAAKNTWDFGAKKRRKARTLNETKLKTTPKIPEPPIEPDKPLVPKNNKPFPLWWPLIGAGGVVIVAALLIVLRKKKKQ
jgi:LPXTG-motif cell wall-anchored protein